MRFTAILRRLSDLNLSGAYLGQIAPAAGQLLLMLMLNHTLGVAEFGTFSLCLATAGFFSQAVGVRTGEAVTYFAKRALIVDSRAGLRRFLIAGVLTDALVATIMIVVGLALTPWIIDGYFQDESLWGVFIICLLLSATTVLKGAWIGSIQALERNMIWGVVIFAEEVAKIALVAFVLVLGGGTLFRVAIAQLTASLAGLIGLILATLWVGRAHWLEKCQFQDDEWKGFRRYLFRNFLTMTLKAGNQRLDVIILGFFASRELVGVFQTIRRILLPLQSALVPLGMAVYTRFISSEVAGEWKRMHRRICQVDLALLLCGLAYLGAVELILLLSPEAFGLSRNIPLGWICVLLWAGLTLQTSLWWVRSFANARDQRMSLVGNAIATAILLGAAIPLGRLFGIWGVAWATLLTQIILQVYWHWMLRAAAEGARP